VVLIGEMRDLETIESALRIAETGHLTLRRCTRTPRFRTIIVSWTSFIFPAAANPRQLSLVLEGVLCQALLPKVDGKGRAMVMESDSQCPPSNLIREGQIHQIYSAHADWDGPVWNADVQSESGQCVFREVNQLWKWRCSVVEFGGIAGYDQSGVTSRFSRGPRRRFAAEGGCGLYFYAEGPQASERWSHH